MFHKLLSTPVKRPAAWQKVFLFVIIFNWDVIKDYWNDFEEDLRIFEKYRGLRPECRIQKEYSWVLIFNINWWHLPSYQRLFKETFLFSWKKLKCHFYQIFIVQERYEKPMLKCNWRLKLTSVTAALDSQWLLSKSKSGIERKRKKKKISCIDLHKCTLKLVCDRPKSGDTPFYKVHLYP